MDLDLVVRREERLAAEVADFGADLEADREFRADMFSFKLLELVRCERLSLPGLVVLCVVFRAIRVGFEIGAAGERFLCVGTSGTGENS
jgi:hypothetical protein